MSLAHRLIDKYFASSRGQLVVGTIPIAELVAEYGTPLYVYDRRVLDAKIDLLRAVLPSRFDLYYSVKANPSLALLRHFLARDCGLEIASAGEFHHALAAGCSPARMLFAGPGKTEAELEIVLENGLGEIHVESLREAQRIGALCQRLGLRAAVAVRINPGGGDAEGGALRMGGTSAPFGVDEEQMAPVIDQILGDERLTLHGIHLFLGTQILDHAALVRQYRRGLDIARAVAAKLGGPLTTVDFGGGLGIPYFENDQELNTGAFAHELRVMLDEIRDEPAFSGTRFVLEPGRFLVGEAGIYVATVHDIKVSRGKKYVITDGGMHHHLAASGNLGQVIRRNFPVAILNKLAGEGAIGPSEKVNVVGPLCTPLDVLARDIALPTAEVGDLVGVFQSGAYARAASPLGFLSHRPPPEVLVDGAEARLIRPRETYEELVRLGPK